MRGSGSRLRGPDLPSRADNRPRDMPAMLTRSASVILSPSEDGYVAYDTRGDLDVLDLGCGTGLNGVQWRPQARRLVGVDLSEPMVVRTRARRQYDVLETAEITAWLAREPTERFDVIVACDTLIYFWDLAQVIEPAGRHRGVLRRAGQEGPFRTVGLGAIHPPSGSCGTSGGGRRTDPRQPG